MRLRRPYPFLDTRTEVYLEVYEKEKQSAYEVDEE